MNPEAEWVASIALPGAMDHGNGWVTFSIYAPGKRSVHLQAGFNGWEWPQDPLTERAPGYWVTARQLESGVHAYRFVLDEEIVVCDPYAQSIRPADDPAEPPHARVHVGRPIYRWRHAHVQRPSLTGDLIVYELHIGDPGRAHGVSRAGVGGGCADRAPAQPHRLGACGERAPRDGPDAHAADVPAAAGAAEPARAALRGCRPG